MEKSKSQQIKQIRNFAAILTTIYVLFLSIFVLDVFQEDLTVFQFIQDLLIHLLPALLILLLFWIARKFNYTGAGLFFAAGASYLFFAWDNMVWQTLVMISGPLFFIGILFLWIGIQNKKIN